MQVIIPSLVAEDRSPVKEDNGVVLGAGIAAVQEGGYTIWSDDVWVRNEVQRWISGAGSVHEALRASPARVPESPARNREKVDGEEDEGGVGAQDVGLVGEVLAVEAGAVDGEVGHSRWVDEPERNLDGFALRGVALGRGRVPVSADARRLVEQDPIGKAGASVGGVAAGDVRVHRGGEAEGDGGEHHWIWTA
jgi:hypothetical protein